MPTAADELSAGPLTLRRWCDVDADATYRAVVESIGHLAPWMAWAARGYTRADADDHRARCEERWGVDFTYAMIAPGGAVAGGCSIMSRSGSDAQGSGCREIGCREIGYWEIGYWVHPAHTGRGYATAAAAALAAEAFRIGADRVEIVHDVANLRSRAIPARLGFTEVDRRPAQEERTAAEAGVDVVWRLLAPAHPG